PQPLRPGDEVVPGGAIARRAGSGLQARDRLGDGARAAGLGDPAGGAVGREPRRALLQPGRETLQALDPLARSLQHLRLARAAVPGAEGNRPEGVRSLAAIVWRA